MIRSDKIRLLFCGLASAGAVIIADYAMENNNTPALPKMKCNLIESGNVATETLGDTLHITLPAGIENNYPSYILCQPK
jgi:hypothetical protein